jgi:hypothetical protein
MEAIVGAKSKIFGMAEAKRRGYGEDGIYFDHRDSAHHKTCPGRWRGVVSLGYGADGAVDPQEGQRLDPD